MNQPVIFLSEGSKRVRGRDAQRINILIAKAVANAVKSTLGPKGMDKMIVDELGDVTISNDGATILDSMSIDHPAGKMMVDVAKTQETEVGDGTTTAVVVAGNLLHKAEKLLDDEIHPSVIIKGYRLASKKAKQLYDSISETIKPNDKKVLENIAMTTMTGKATEGSEVLSKLVVEAIMQVSETENGKTIIDLDNIKVEKKKGSCLDESQLVKGIVIDKEIVHSGMPTKIENAKIALIDSALEIESTEIDAKIQITNPDQLQDFLNQEEKMLKDMVTKIKEAGANVVICQKGIDDLAQHFLAKEGIAAVRRVKKSDIEALAKATGANIVTRINDMTKEELGKANRVISRKVAGDDMVFIEGCKNPKAVSILIRGGTDQVIDEADRAVDDALGSVSSAIRVGKIVYGGGSCEVDVAIKLRKYANSIGGREQLAIEAFAETLELIPRTLAETAGMDPLDTIVSLKSQHSNKNGTTYGVDVFKAKTIDMKREKIIEPLNVKTQAITSGTEAAEMILRIDDIIAGKSSGGAPAGPPGGMPPGMGGMPPMM